MQPEDLVGQTLGHYRIQRQIGYGGMATVFLAEDIHLAREVAIKVFWPRPGETQDFLRRFAREARVLAQLDHAHILPVYDYGEQGELAYLVTPYMAGGTLRDVLQKRKALPPSEAIELITQVLPALQYAHDRNLVHRDIKPGNLLFKADGSLVLADFGLVKVVGNDEHSKVPLETLAQTTQNIAGTPEYMAPEQIEGVATAASDVYAMGVVLYEMVTGTRPFTGTSLLSTLVKIVQDKPRPPRELNPYISPALEAAILRALEKDPARRFASPTDFQQALLQVGKPQSGRINNPASNPGLGMGEATVAQTSPTASASRLPMPLSPETLASSGMLLPNAAFQNMPTTNQQTRADSLQSGQMVLPGQAGINEPIRPLQQAWISHQALQQALPRPEPVKKRRAPVVVLVILLLLVAGTVSALFLTPVGSGLLGINLNGTMPPGSTGTQTPGSQITDTPTTVVTPTPGVVPTPTPINDTKPVPATSTSCPNSGTARSAIVAPLSLGNHPVIVYIANEGPTNAPTAGTVKLYNTATGKKIELASMKAAIVNEAQVSNNGQWILFTVTVAGQSQLRMVRLDGKGLQTLYCAAVGNHITAAQWSINQKFVIFDELPEVGSPTIYLLNLQSGALQVEVKPSTGGISLLPRTWLDANHVLMTGFVPNSDAPLTNVYLLNIGKGANQETGTIPLIFNSSNHPSCWDFDSNNEGNALYIAQCTPMQPSGSGSIIKQGVNGTSPGSVLNSTTLALSSVRVVDAHNAYLLAIASDSSMDAPNGDPDHDGLYLIKTSDGSFQRLLNTDAGTSSMLNSFSQYFWSNISRDGKMYTVQQVNWSANQYSLAYGKLNGETPKVFAEIANTALALVGWTTI